MYTIFENLRKRLHFSVEANVILWIVPSNYNVCFDFANWPIFIWREIKTCFFIAGGKSPLIICDDVADLDDHENVDDHNEINNRDDIDDPTDDHEDHDDIEFDESILEAV